jgi:phosphatidate phosphatase APP1
MTAKKTGIIPFIHNIETIFDRFKYSIKKKRKNHTPIYLMPYLGFGTKDVFYLRGRVLENKGITIATPTDTIWTNIHNMFKRFESDEVPKTEIKVAFNQKEYLIKTDEEGYFELNFEPGSLTSSKQWEEVELEIINAPIPFSKGIKSISKILVPSANSSFGIISDIDDTIVETNATSILKMTLNTFLNNAKTRSPFKGVAEFYQALEKGKNLKEQNPFFYVSSSPWNLYDLLLDFLITHKIPLGPLLLKDYGIENNTSLSSNHLTHKYFHIQRVLTAYPKLPFILVGDSGQQDPAIYEQVVKDFPDRIKCIYIRDVNIPKHLKKTLLISEELNKGKVPMILIKDSDAAAEHAVKAGFISSQKIVDIEKGVEKDSKEKTDLSQNTNL